MKNILLIILFCVSLVLFVYFFLRPRSLEISNVMLNNTTKDVVMETRPHAIEAIAYEDAMPSRDITITSYSSRVASGENVTISWEYNSALASFGDSMTLCLVAFDSNNDVIDTRDKNEDACFYRFGGAHSSYKLGTGSLQSKNFEILLPKDIGNNFLIEPTFYTIQIVFLDDRPKGVTSEWGGLVGYAETGKVLIN